MPFPDKPYKNMLNTSRLIIRSWGDADADDFYQVNSDPKTMATLGAPLTYEENAALIMRMRLHEDRHGFCFWAMELRDMDEDMRYAHGLVIGWCGLIRSYEGSPIEGRLEIGWRVASQFWRRGYAYEAACATINWARAVYPEEDIWAMTSKENEASYSLMEKLGMHRHREWDFDHPQLSSDDPLRPHIIYHLTP